MDVQSYNFGDKLQYLRKLRGMTQGELSALTHETISAINRYENNEIVPKKAVIAKLALALDVTPKELMLYLTPQSSLTNKG